MKEALLYERLADNQVRCQLYAHRCLIPEGKLGICQVRENENGILYTRVYGRTIGQLPILKASVDIHPIYNDIENESGYNSKLLAMSRSTHLVQQRKNSFPQTHC